jgi:hypothetical protein
MKNSGENIPVQSNNRIKKALFAAPTMLVVKTNIHDFIIIVLLINIFAYCFKLKGNFLMTYDNSDEVSSPAKNMDLRQILYQ